MEAPTKEFKGRVVIENFRMTEGEMERLWAEQNKYIDLLERRLREGEEEAWRMTSRREYLLMLRLIRKEEKLREQTDKIAELKASLAPSSVKMRQISVEKIKHDHDYSSPQQGAGVNIKHDHDYSTRLKGAGF